MEFRIIHRRGAEFAEARVFDYESSELCALCVSVVNLLTRGGSAADKPPSAPG
jgi:hypothetical protein